MKLFIFTIVLDGMPFIANHLDEFNKLKCDWQWFIVEGAAAPTKDTSWCKPQEFRLSKDGTHEYLMGLNHPRVKVVCQPRWENKTAMVNAAVRQMGQPGALLEVDCDEMWKAEQIDKIVELFDKNASVTRMSFFCRYYFGPDIVVLSPDLKKPNSGWWLRAWRYKRGQIFERHEPPILSGSKGGIELTPKETEAHGLVFDHYSYVIESQVAYKEMFYGYVGAVAGWKRLQENTEWPVKIKPFIHWADDKTYADKIR